VFPTRKRFVLVHLTGKVIRTRADHPFFIQGRGWVNAGDLPGAQSDGEQEVVYHLNLGEPAMPDRPRPNFPVVGFAAGTPLRTPEGCKPIEQFRPGDPTQTQPDGRGDGAPQAHEGHDDDAPSWWERN
jgi:hypothetical protein